MGLGPSRLALLITASRPTCLAGSPGQHPPVRLLTHIAGNGDHICPRHNSA